MLKIDDIYECTKMIDEKLDNIMDSKYLTDLGKTKMLLIVKNNVESRINSILLNEKQKDD